VLAQWEEIKREVEGTGEREPLEGLPENLPALLYARKVLRRVDPEGSAGGEKPGGPTADPDERDEAERLVGELLLEAVVASRKLGVDPELALRQATQRLATGG
jgi:XTP/dITP diphosphohydrolase